MSFTDDDLRRLKEVINDEEPHPINEYSIFLNALLARLEAAELVIHFHGRLEAEKISYNRFVEALNAWRKAKGEGK